MPWKLNIAIYQESAHLSSLDATHSYIWYSQFCNVPLYVFHECSIRSSTLSGVSCQHNVKGYWIILQFALGFGHLCCLFIIILGGPCPSYHFERGGTSFIWAVFLKLMKEVKPLHPTQSPHKSPFPSRSRWNCQSWLLKPKPPKPQMVLVCFVLAGEHALNQFGYGFF